MHDDTHSPITDVLDTWSHHVPIHIGVGRGAVTFFVIRGIVAMIKRKRPTYFVRDIELK